MFVFLRPLGLRLESLGVTAETAGRLVSRAVAGLRDDAERILAVWSTNRQVGS